MSKILPILLLIMMGMHIIKPLGVPGLRKRSDFWKIAVIALAAMTLAVAVHLQG